MDIAERSRLQALLSDCRSNVRQWQQQVKITNAALREENRRDVEN